MSLFRLSGEMGGGSRGGGGGEYLETRLKLVHCEHSFVLCLKKLAAASWILTQLRVLCESEKSPPNTSSLVAILRPSTKVCVKAEPKQRADLMATSPEAFKVRHACRNV